MASIASACRLSARVARRQLRQYGSTRAFHPAPTSLAAHNFTMPALSPTMTEGNIASWKVKEGDSFSAGDVLLEIETDKAQMDVEAQDDGKLAKITQGDGSKGVQVGSRIAVTAEPDDDLSSLEIPAEDKPAEAPKKESKEASPSKPKAESTPPLKEQKPSQPAPSSSESSEKSPQAQAQKQKYPLYPSVAALLKENGLAKEDADTIPSTGPGGRLLKGDVLAYLGVIEKSYPLEQSKRIGKLSHLDLSNIKIAPPKKEAAPEKPATAPDVVEEVDTEIAVPISLTAVLECQKRIKDSVGIFLPISTFIARATELANDGLPRSKTAKPSADELFNAVLGLDKVSGPSVSRGYFVPQVTALPPVLLKASKSAPKKGKSDILDILAGRKSVSRSVSAPITGGATGAVAPVNVFSVSVPKGDERRAQVFLERVKVVLEAEPGRLVL
ncbi:uncharacterized protein BDZ99DRAFT_408775 [Mytilinidion resinicola]|uniref:Pyruvate dehydrogenase protein x component n=1 Tax=Mytilinidion resinicola TaxID=574789 RepID=A0A6A6Z481_9PEZI|nr:uncharacterized protein BDZ99DRAFT_408775 [Mytilinidion resinicola]KAF2815094.1 hypothetical protein BDZ99DRAFT_408775 [Mytilinidion resinicola]